MRRRLVVRLAVLFLAGPIGIASTCAQVNKAASDEESMIKVEIHGKLRAPDGDAAGPDDPPVITADGISIALEFKKDPPTPARLSSLKDRRIVVRGTLKKGPRDRLICVVEGEMTEDRPAPAGAGAVAQYLVGYRDGQQAALKEFSRTLGLKVVDDNVPGKYLILETTGESAAEFLDKLKAHKAARYVEKNMEFKIPEKE